MLWHEVTSSTKTINLKVGAFGFSEYLSGKMSVDCCMHQSMGEALLQTQSSFVNPSDSQMDINYNNNSLLDSD